MHKILTMLMFELFLVTGKPARQRRMLVDLKINLPGEILGLVLLLAPG
jgi:putative effector of murein hydrolase LrgA (UPF0299 family)